MVRKKETENFLPNKRRNSSSNSTNCPTKWWHQGFQHQKTLARIAHSKCFSILVIVLVIIDTALIIGEIMLDSFLVHYECKADARKISKHEQHIMKHRVELGMEIAHFSSIAILSFFVLELIVKIYAVGKEFWNIRKNKMEYFDAFIVITSLIIDLYFLQGEKLIIGEELILIFVFRLWRFLRIVNSVAEGVRNTQIKHKQHLLKEYDIVVQRLVEVVKHKTTYFENNREYSNSNYILEHYQLIDDQCQKSLDELNNNHELRTAEILHQFIEDLNGLENKNKDTVISAMFVGGSEV